MFALKFFDLCPALDRDLLQFPGGHGHQRTKVSRDHQWENGSTGGMLAPHLVASEQSGSITSANGF
jgi:hypothetical protein